MNADQQRDISHTIPKCALTSARNSGLSSKLPLRNSPDGCLRHFVAEVDNPPLRIRIPRFNQAFVRNQEIPERGAFGFYDNEPVIGR